MYTLHEVQTHPRDNFSVPWWGTTSGLTDAIAETIAQDEYLRLDYPSPCSEGAYEMAQEFVRVMCNSLKNGKQGAELELPSGNLIVVNVKLGAYHEEMYYAYILNERGQ